MPFIATWCPGINLGPNPVGCTTSASALPQLQKCCKALWAGGEPTAVLVSTGPQWNRCEPAVLGGRVPCWGAGRLWGAGGKWCKGRSAVECNMGRIDPGGGRGGNTCYLQILYPLPGHRLTQVSSVLCPLYSGCSTDPSRPFGVAWAQHGLIFPCSQEDLLQFPCPAGYSNGHFTTAVLLGTGEA